jgi:hypothetical protein
VLSPQFWLYPVITLAVMSATLVPIVLWLKCVQQQDGTARSSGRKGWAMMREVEAEAEAAGWKMTQC